MIAKKQADSKVCKPLDPVESAASAIPGFTGAAKFVSIKPVVEAPSGSSSRSVQQSEPSRTKSGWYQSADTMTTGPSNDWNWKGNWNWQSNWSQSAPATAKSSEGSSTGRSDIPPLVLRSRQEVQEQSDKVERTPGQIARMAAFNEQQKKQHKRERAQRQKRRKANAEDQWW